MKLPSLEVFVLSFQWSINRESNCSLISNMYTPNFNFHAHSRIHEFHANSVHKECVSGSIVNCPSTPQIFAGTLFSCKFANPWISRKLSAQSLSVIYQLPGTLKIEKLGLILNLRNSSNQNPRNTSARKCPSPVKLQQYSQSVSMQYSQLGCCSALQTAFHSFLYIGYSLRQIQVLLELFKSMSFKEQKHMCIGTPLRIMSS